MSATSLWTINYGHWIYSKNPGLPFRLTLFRVFRKKCVGFAGFVRLDKNHSSLKLRFRIRFFLFLPNDCTKWSCAFIVLWFRLFSMCQVRKVLSSEAENKYRPKNKSHYFSKFWRSVKQKICKIGILIIWYNISLILLPFGWNLNCLTQLSWPISEKRHKPTETSQN